MCGCTGGEDEDGDSILEHHVAKVPHPCHNDSCGRSIPVGAVYFVGESKSFCSTGCREQACGSNWNEKTGLLFGMDVAK